MNKLQGELILNERALKIQLNDLAESDLQMNLAHSENEQANQLISFVGDVTILDEIMLECNYCFNSIKYYKPISLIGKIFDIIKLLKN